MRHLLTLTLALSLGLLACTESESGKTRRKSKNTPVTTNVFTPEHGQTGAIQFAHTIMNFGPVPSGDTVYASYKFANLGQASQRIENVIVSCPCIKTEFPQGNLAPGAQGEIKVQFHTEGFWGRHEKILAVQIAGEQIPLTLRLNGEISRIAGQ